MHNSNKRLSERETQRVISDLLSALMGIYEAGLAVWDLSPETPLLQIGQEMSFSPFNSSEELKEQGEQRGGCFKQLDSLRRNHFEVKLKDLAISKRAYCKSKLVCVPDSVLNRSCNADVYAIGMLILQLVLGLDLFRTSE